MHKRKEAQGSFKLKQNFSGTGVIGNDSYDARGHVRLNLAIEGVGPTNVVKVYGRIQFQSTWIIIQTFTGPTIALSSATVTQVEEVQFVCTTYEANGTPLLLVSGGFL